MRDRIGIRRDIGRRIQLKVDDDVIEAQRAGDRSGHVKSSPRDSPVRRRSFRTLAAGCVGRQEATVNKPEISAEIGYVARLSAHSPSLRCPRATIWSTSSGQRALKRRRSDQSARIQTSTPPAPSG